MANDDDTRLNNDNDKDTTKMKRTYNTRPSQGAPLKRLDGGWRRHVTPELDAGIDGGYAGVHVACGRCRYLVCSCAQPRAETKPVNRPSGNDMDVECEAYRHLPYEGVVARVEDSDDILHGRIARVVWKHGVTCVLQVSGHGNARVTRLVSSLSLWERVADGYGRMTHAFRVGDAVELIGDRTSSGSFRGVLTVARAGDYGMDVVVANDLGHELYIGARAIRHVSTTAT